MIPFEQQHQMKKVTHDCTDLQFRSTDNKAGACFESSFGVYFSLICCCLYLSLFHMLFLCEGPQAVESNV